MKVLITGGAGFIGSHLAEFLCSKNFQVKVYDRYNSLNNYGWLESSKFKNKIDVRLGDIRDYDVTEKMCSDCDYILHLAALIGIPYSFKAPKSYIETNVVGTYNILEVAKKRRVKKIILTSTSEVYGSAKKLPMDEKHILNPQSPYAASKISADHLGMSYYYSYKMPINILRPFNAYGPRQSDRAVIPTIINQTLNKKKNEISLGNTFSKRDFTYVEDICNAYYLLLKKEISYGNIFNTGTNKSFQIRQIYKKIINIIGSKKKMAISKERFRPNLSEVDELKSDYKKIRNKLGWKPNTSLDNGLEKTIKWYKSNSISQSKSNKYVV